MFFISVEIATAASGFAMTIIYKTEIKIQRLRAERGQVCFQKISESI